MPSPRGASALLERLAKLKGMPATPEARALVLLGLASRASVVVEKAAKTAAELGLTDLCPEFSAAFNRFMSDPAYVDRGCGAKTALARAAVNLKCAAAQAMFLAGIHHVQDEVVAPEPYDSAVELRQLCAIGLVQIRYPDVMNELVQLLLDRVAQARMGAARAMAHTGREDATYVLRMKVLMG